MVRSSEAIILGKELVRNTHQNIDAAGIANATTIDAHLTQDKIGNSTRLKINYSSPVTPFALKQKYSILSRASEAEQIHSVLKQYQHILGGSDQTKSNLIEQFNKFENSAAQLINNADMSSRQSFIDQAQRLAENYNQSVDEIKNLRETTHSDITRLIHNANNDINTLFEINKSLEQINKNSPGTFEMRRNLDQAITSLSQKFAINVTYGANGTAFVKLNNSGTEIVSPIRKSHFVMDGHFNHGDSGSTDPKDLSIYLENVTHGNDGSSILVHGGNEGSKLLHSGVFGGLVQLRDSYLREGLDAICFMKNTVFNEVNKIHNSGTAWPPATKLTAQNLFTEEDIVDFKGKMSILALNDKGYHLHGNAGRILESKIDFDNLKGRGTNGALRIRDIVSEMNYVMNRNLTEVRVSLGEMSFHGSEVAAPDDVTVSKNEFLINNMRLVASDDIQNNQFKFDIEADGNSHFGSFVEIKQVSVNGVASVNNLPSEVRLDRDASGRLGFDLSEAINGAVNQKITLDIRVTGDNGVVQDGQITFDVDGTDTKTLNKRFYFDQANAPTGDFVVSNQMTSTGTAIAKLVDKNGVEIKDDASNAKGRIIIESNDPAIGIGLQGSDFGYKMGFNNLFDTSDEKVNVHKSIVDDPRKLILGKVTDVSEKHVVAIGKDKATNTLITSLGAGNFSNGDTVTIDTTVFTFGAGGLNLGISTSTSLDNLANAINAHPKMQNKFKAEPVNLSLKIESINGGAYYNKFTAAFNFGGGGQTGSINGTAYAANGTNNFVGGTDQKIESEIHNCHIGDKSSEIAGLLANLNSVNHYYEGAGIVPPITTTLHGFISNVITSFSNQANDAKANFDIQDAVHKHFDKKFKDEFGIKKEDQMRLLAEQINYMKASARAYGAELNLEREILDLFKW